MLHTQHFFPDTIFIILVLDRVSEDSEGKIDHEDLEARSIKDQREQLESQKKSVLQNKELLAAVSWHTDQAVPT